jgi:4-amino-4-deoxy-L-arabinose transferase-like glycosyltransferase
VNLRWTILVIFALALAVRLAVVVEESGDRPIYDAKEYDDIARSVADSGRYPSSWYAKPGSPAALRPPAYPYLLGATYEVTGESVTAGRVLGAVLGTVAVGLTALIALQLWGSVAATIAGLLAALYPPLVWTNGSLMSESLFIPVVLGLVLLLLRPRRAGGRVALLTAAAAGALCGIATLTRPVGLVLTVVALVWTWRAPLPAPRRVAAGALLVGAMLVTLTPWTIRNEAAFGRFVPVSTQDGFNLAGTYNEQAARSGPDRATWQPPFIVPKFKPLFSDGLDEEQINGRLRSAAIRYARDHPDYALTALGLNSLRLFGLGPGHVGAERVWYGEMGIPQRAQPWVRYSVYVMAALALAGVALRRRELPMALWLVPLLLFLSVAFIHGGPRYRAPLDPFLVLLAAAAFARLIEGRLSSRPAVASGPSSAGTAAPPAGTTAPRGGS